MAEMYLATALMLGLTAIGAAIGVGFWVENF